MKARFFTLAAILGVGLGVLASCSDPIYATIETEKKSATNTLPLLMSVFDIAVTAPGSTYYVAAGAVFQGVLSGPGGTVTWTPNTDNTSRPFNPPGTPICNAMALFNGALWGGFITQSGNASLYQSNGSFLFANSTPSSLLPPGEQVTLLKAAGTVNPLLFVGGVDASVSNYELDTYDGTTWTIAKSGLTRPVTGVGFDGANFWFASGSTVYKASETAGAPFTLTGIVDATPPALVAGPDQINGLFATKVGTANVVIVLTKTKGVFYTTDGGLTWKNATPSLPNGSANPAAFLCAAGPVNPSGTSDLYLVGSDGNNTTGFGYYTLSTTTGAIDRFSDTTILLYTSSVSRILVDGPNVLIGTNYNGLWRGVFDQTTGQILSGTNQYWIHE